jgi:uncharacterized membrane protein YfcA
MLLIILVLCVAGFVRGLTGFGYGLVAMALLPLFLDLPRAAAIVGVLDLTVSGVAFFANRKHYDWRRGLNLVLGSCCGIPLGVYLLVEMPPQLLLRVLGAVMVMAALNEWRIRRCSIKSSMPDWLGFPLGLLSGALGGALNTGGPPAIAYAYSQPWSKQQTIAFLQVVFGLSSLLRLLFFGVGGLLTPTSLELLAWAAPPVILSILLGTLLCRKVPQTHLKTGIFLFLALMGLHYLLR